jgi:hypothetical protein
VVCLLTLLVLWNVASGIWDSDTSVRKKNWIMAVAVAVIGTSGLLLTFKVHWYPATDGNPP